MNLASGRRRRFSMSVEQLSFWTRLYLAFVLPWKVLFNAAFAARVQPLLDAAPSPTVTVAKEPVVRDTSAALQLLALLQREGRFVDFLQENVTGFSDQDVGAAARVVHEGCRKALK